jgi:hypothetical protein
MTGHDSRSARFALAPARQLDKNEHARPFQDSKITRWTRIPGTGLSRNHDNQNLK